MTVARRQLSIARAHKAYRAGREHRQSDTPSGIVSWRKVPFESGTRRAHYRWRPAEVAGYRATMRCAHRYAYRIQRPAPGHPSSCELRPASLPISETASDVVASSSRAMPSRTAATRTGYDNVKRRKACRISVSKNVSIPVAEKTPIPIPFSSLETAKSASPGSASDYDRSPVSVSYVLRRAANKKTKHHLARPSRWRTKHEDAAHGF